MRILAVSCDSNQNYTDEIFLVFKVAKGIMLAQGPDQKVAANKLSETTYVINLLVFDMM